MLVFSLDYEILLSSGYTITLMNDSFREEKFNQVKLTTIIRPQALNFEVKLNLNIVEKILYNRIGLRFVMH